MTKKAKISQCGKYRYFLERHWGEGDKTVLFIGLNPSIADADIDDPTIRRCINFAKSWGYDRLWMGNVMPFRSTNPNKLYNGNNHSQQSNRSNFYWLRAMIREADLVVCAWGANEVLVDVGDLYDGMFKSKGAKCLGKTKTGKPKHPLYLKGDTPLIDY